MRHPEAYNIFKILDESPEGANPKSLAMWKLIDRVRIFELIIQNIHLADAKTNLFFTKTKILDLTNMFGNQTIGLETEN